VRAMTTNLPSFSLPPPSISSHSRWSLWGQ
jgi:hypothetical protein